MILALSERGPEWRRLEALARSAAEIQISAVAWYEFARGPRTADQMAVARSFFFEDGVIPFSEQIAERAAVVFRSLGAPRRRAADIAIGVTAAARDAILLTRNRADFDGIPGLQLAGTD